jgi:hypothetical protein
MTSHAKKYFVSNFIIFIVAERMLYRREAAVTGLDKALV